MILAAGRFTAQVKHAGAELCSLKDGAGREYMWQAGEAWPRHAPILFPIVGRLRDDTLDFGAQQYRMGQHGFARDLRFELVESRAAACRFLLTDSEATHAAFPFPFRLEVAYALRGSKGKLTLGSASAKFKKAGVYRLSEHLSPAEMAKLRGAKSFSVRFAIPKTPKSCGRYYTKRLTIPRKVSGQTVWFQSDSRFAPGG